MHLSARAGAYIARFHSGSGIKRHPHPNPKFSVEGIYRKVVTEVYYNKQVNMIWNILRPFAACAALLAAAACTDHPSTTEVTEQYKSTRATSGTEAQRIVTAAGIADFSSVGKSTAETNAAIVSGTGMAASLYNSGIGFGNFGTFGMGVVSFLAAPPQSMASFDALLALYPASTDPAQVGASLQKELLRPYLTALEDEGYIAEPDPHPSRTGQVIFKKPGCKSCMQSMSVLVQERGTTGHYRVFEIGTTNYSKPKSNLLNAANPWPTNKDYDTAFKVIDRMNGKLAFYVAPKKTSQGWTEPMLYYRGKLQPLLTQ